MEYPQKSEFIKESEGLPLLNSLTKNLVRLYCEVAVS